MAGHLRLLAAIAGLTGCGSVPASINPVAWWHDLQGGVIAEQRPPPPGATDPYPNIASVPERPAPLDPAIRQAINQGLVADRANAQHEASTTPIPDPSSRQTSPGLFGAASPTPASPPPASPPPAGPSASFAAASAPPPDAPPPVAPPSALAGDAVLGQQPQGSVAQMGALPKLPTAPPAPANLPGASPPPPRPARPPPAPPAGAPRPAGSVSVPFAPGTATLAPEAAALLHTIAVQRKETAGIVVVGNGEAAGSDPATQQAALTLARLRAQAIARALIAEGVPADAVVTDAQAEGRGAAVRLVN